ncbi:kinase [Escherichia coli]|nr:kinase [Escherichia coli]EJQ6580613.1 kinase [Escherichia coli]MEB7929793.1 MoaD/ThiS family protein [Escherichia coli]
MTIRIYPSRLPGEPLETHEHGATTLHHWMKENVRGYRSDMKHPVAVEVDGESIPPQAWFDYALRPDSDVRIYPVPFGLEAATIAWIGVGISVAVAAYSLIMMSNMDKGGYSSASANGLDLNPAKANTARLGDPIREVFGRYRIYPDYVVQPVTRFDKDDPTRMTVEMFLCLGTGRFSFAEGDIRIGATPVASLGKGFSYTVYRPGAVVSGDSRSENWFNSTEVGGTSSGTGLDMAQTAPTSADILAESITVSGAGITFNGLENADKLPWWENKTVQLVVPASYVVTSDGDYSRITGDILEEIAPYVGMPVTLNYSGTDHTLVIASYTPHSEAVDGSGGVTASITLAYDTATGVAFTGLPEGWLRLSVAHAGNRYRILSLDGSTVTVRRVLSSGVTDTKWPGFTARTVLDFEADGVNDNEAWMGPFLACPENETVDMFEVNFSFPNGICGFNKKGKKRSHTVEWEIQYRIYGSGDGWVSCHGHYSLSNVNGLGFTERVTLPAPGLVEVRCRRRNEQGRDNARDSMYWQALRGRLLARPAAYQGVTTLGITVETGGKLAAQSDRRVNVVATRIYDFGKPRSISGALHHIGKSAGLRMDATAINEMDRLYWRPRGEYFDYATTDSDSVLNMLQKITNAGHAYFLFADGMASVGYEGVKPWTGIISPQEMTEDLQTAFTAPSDDDYDGVDVTYINGTTWTEETVQCRTADNPAPVKLESYSLDGVTDRDRAYRIGMRRLMKYRHRRLSFTTTTEMDALCYNTGDRIILTDDIPGNLTLSCLITGMKTDNGFTTFTLSEAPDWTYPSPRVLIRYQDGTVSGLLEPVKVSRFRLSVPYQSAFDEILTDTSVTEPPRLIFCDSSRVGYDAVIEEIAPQSDGTCTVTAREYRDSFYDYDNATYPGDVS